MHLRRLRYPGGKASLSYRITGVLLRSRLLGGTFVEPFAGGAGVALALLFEERVSNVVLNDLDVRVFAFWDSVVKHADEFCSQILRTPVPIEEQERQKWLFEAPEEYSAFYVGFSAFLSESDEPLRHSRRRSHRRDRTEW